MVDKESLNNYYQYNYMIITFEYTCSRIKVVNCTVAYKQRKQCSFGSSSKLFNF